MLVNSCIFSGTHECVSSPAATVFFWKIYTLLLLQDDLIASMYSECIQALLSASEKVVLILRAENKTDRFAWLNM